MILQHKFIEFRPKELEDGVLYISMEYNSAIHKCVCGCGELVVTPLSPSEWQLTYNGKCITLYPSIGNWHFECKSHYWIRNSEVIYARKWTDEEIKVGHEKPIKKKKKYFSNWWKKKKYFSNWWKKKKK
ncbi:DUF6527 family protein [uncultured Flavobacterium sp.]|uniref:DUF6527 family protein n=1 Tax=uncultured Flavobacterium sp. TaxID=165435 RepID=UPI0025950BA6|nr:DUF6527 family protein [uncultured Flavobacterium sp.]